MTGILSIIQLVGQLVIINNICIASLFVYTKAFRKFYCTSRQALLEDTKIMICKTNARISRFNTLVQTDRRN